MSKTFGGAASDAAETTAGKFKRMKIALDETKESIGASLMPAVEAVLPYLQGMADWAQKNPQVFTTVAIALAAIAASVVAINIAMSLNPISLIAIGIGLLVAGAVLAYKKFETFRGIVDTVFSGIRWWVTNVTVPVFKLLYETAKWAFENIAKLWNNTLGGLSFKIPEWVKYTGPVGMLLAGKSFSIPSIPTGDGGGGGFTSARAFEESQKAAAAIPSALTAPPVVVTAPGKIQNSATPIFDNTSGNAGGFENAGIGGIQGLNINIDAGLISSPATIGQDIIDAILAAQRNSGVVFAPAGTL
jgi:prepilin signal peptidase PulO-like enzyme (type II secretory pathway)